jgi:hypothetical protein
MDIGEKMIPHREKLTITYFFPISTKNINDTYGRETSKKNSLMTDISFETRRCDVDVVR